MVHVQPFIGSTEKGSPKMKKIEGTLVGIFSSKCGRI